MRFFVMFLEVKSFEYSKEVLIEFKSKLAQHGQVTVVETEESNYNFLHNSLVEKANNEQKGRKTGP